VVRIVFFALLLANLAYFAWAHWVDVPSPPPANEISKLPRLKLAEEVPPEQRKQPGSAHRTVLTDPAVCLSIGPFADPDTSARAVALLREKGFEPRQRAEQGGSSEGYWVYVGGLKSEADADQALVALEHGGIKDAVLMPESPEGGRRLSLGMFSERAHAEKRAQSVRQQTGLEAEIADRKLSGAAYWIDVSAPSGTNTMPLEKILAQGLSSSVGVQACPVAPATAPTTSPPPTGIATADPSSRGAATAAASAGGLAATQLR
jgi:SPOR domain